MKLAQGQVWKAEGIYYRIVKWSRLAIDYKAMSDLATKEGTNHHVSKKEFCRLIRHAELVDPATVSALQKRMPEVDVEEISER